MKASSQPVQVRGACPHDCPDTCALLTTVQDGVAIKVQGNPENRPTDGVLCTKAPITRSPILQTDAASAADLAIPVTPAMVGTTRYYQWWFRDPQDAFSDGLSNGLEVEFCD